MHYDSTGIVIYVGKAKNLQNRLKSYFTKAHNLVRQKFINEIHNFSFIVTTNEKESLLLESNYIKKYQPKYNILLKDDKSYPYIMVTKEEHPRLLLTRKPNFKKNTVYGPLPDGFSAREIYVFLQKIFPLRKCNILPTKSCIYGQLKQCLEPCINNVSYSEYDLILKKINNFFSGKFDNIVSDLEIKMHKFSDNMQFEKAQSIKNLIEKLNKMQDSQVIEFQDTYNRDVIGFYSFNNYISISILCYRNGKLINVINKLSFIASTNDDVISAMLFNYYKDNLIPHYVNIENYQEYTSLEEIFGFKLIKQDNQKFNQLMKLAFLNAQEYLNNNLKEKLLKEVSRSEAWNVLKEILKTENLSDIEVYDNSHYNGVNYIGAVVVFRNGIEMKSENRSYNLDTKTTNDISAFKEVIKRRYSKNELNKIPDLIIVDGGLAQINIVKEVLNELNHKIIVVGLKKDTTHRTHYLVLNEKEEINLKENKELLNLLSWFQISVHNYAINSHRKSRIKSFIDSELLKIPGVGKETAKKLLSFFGSIDNIRKQNYDKIILVVRSQKIAKNVVDFFK